MASFLFCGLSALLFFVTLQLSFFFLNKHSRQHCLTPRSLLPVEQLPEPEQRRRRTSYVGYYAQVQGIEQVGFPGLEVQLEGHRSRTSLKRCSSRMQAQRRHRHQRYRRVSSSIPHGHIGSSSLSGIFARLASTPRSRGTSCTRPASWHRSSCTSPSSCRCRCRRQNHIHLVLPLCLSLSICFHTAFRGMSLA